MTKRRARGTETTKQRVGGTETTKQRAGGTETTKQRGRDRYIYQTERERVEEMNPFTKKRD